MDWCKNKEVFPAATMLAIALIVCSLNASAQPPEPPELSRVESEIVVNDLENLSDFSISRDGETIFVAAAEAKQIRRIKGDSNELVITGIEHDEEVATAISVFAIDDNHIVVGVAGFSSPKFAMTLFDLSASTKLPLKFADDLVQPSRTYQRKIKRSDAFDVLQIFQQQRGVSIVRQIGDDNPKLCDVPLKDGSLETLTDGEYHPEISKSPDLSTLAVDPLGGYIVSVTPDADGTSKLTFSQAEGVIIQSFSLKLPRVRSLGFTPEGRRLYALVVEGDSEPEEASLKAGIYEIQSSGADCSAELVLPIRQPQKMKLDAHGNAWVLCKMNSHQKSHLLKVTGLTESRSK